MNRITGLYLRIIRRKRQQHIARQAIAEAPNDERVRYLAK
jgi:hypothetical protein